jgi:hypothetical protein
MECITPTNKKKIKLTVPQRAGSFDYLMLPNSTKSPLTECISSAGTFSSKFHYISIQNGHFQALIYLLILHQKGNIVTATL